jgi:AraC-like DNA-binding protein
VDPAVVVGDTLDEAGPVAVRRMAPGIEVHGGRTRSPRVAHVLNGSDLLLVVGSPLARLRCRGKEWRVGASFVSVVESGDVIAVDQPSDSSFRLLHLAPGLLHGLPDAPPEIHRSASGIARIAWVAAGPGLCELVDDIDQEDAVAEFVACTRLAARCRIWIAAAEPVAHAVVCRARDYLREHFARKVTIDELARRAGMSRFALVRAFAREVGIPPHTYQTHLRVQQARELIAEGVALSEVSLAVGFADQSHLNRHFKRLIGVTPGLYARAIAGTKNVHEHARRAV